jgi:hypothetical protein
MKTAIAVAAAVAANEFLRILKMHPTDFLAALIPADVPGSEGFLQ